jgi:hypothetical protein
MWIEISTTAPKPNVQVIIDDMMFLLGLSSETQLCGFFNVTQGTISKWKKRGAVPSKYKRIVDDTVLQRAKGAVAVSTITVSIQEVAEALGLKKESKWIYSYKKKNPALYAIIEDGVRMKKASQLGRKE